MKWTCKDTWRVRRGATYDRFRICRSPRERCRKPTARRPDLQHRSPYLSGSDPVVVEATAVTELTRASQR
jgi:hypothetical protein